VFKWSDELHNLIPRLQRLSSNSGTPTTPTGGPPPLDGEECDLLTMYQSQWATMHHMAVQNGKLGQVNFTCFLATIILDMKN